VRINTFLRQSTQPLKMSYPYSIDAGASRAQSIPDHGASSRSDPGLRLLSTQQWFPKLDAVDQTRLLSAFKYHSGRKNEKILSAGVVSEGWFAVVSGFVMLRSPNEPYKSCPLIALSAGEWFGEGCVIDDIPRPYEVLALREKTRLLCIPRHTFSFMLSSNVHFAQGVLQHSNRRLSQAISLLEATRVSSLEQRVALILSPMFWRDGPPPRLSQAEIGSLAGMSRQATNRALRVLEERGVLSMSSGQVTATCPEALTQFAKQRSALSPPHPNWVARQAAASGLPRADFVI